MKDDITFRINEYFSLTEKEKQRLIHELSEFYFEKFISNKSEELFEFTLGELIWRLEMEQRFAELGEKYNRAEIYKKLSEIFYKLREEEE